MKKAVVFGASGFLGNAVARNLIGKGIEVFAVVKPGTACSDEAWRMDGLESQTIECDLSEVSELSRKIQDRDIDVFYQFAWDGLEKEKLLNYELQLKNVAWMLDSAVTASELGCKKFIGAGTITQEELSYEEGIHFQKDKHRYYRVAQQTCALLGRSIEADFHIGFIWPEIINVYGEGEVSARLVNTMIKNLLEGKPQLASWGNQIYDFLYVTDAAEAYYLLGEKGKSDSKYMIGSGDPKPLREYLNQIKEIVNRDAVIQWGALGGSGFYLPKEAYDTMELQKDTGFKPKVSFEEGIRKTMEWIGKRNDAEN